MPSLVTASWRGHKFSVRPTFWKRVDREPTTRRGQGLSQPSLRNLVVTCTHYIFRGDPLLQGQSWREPFDSCTLPHAAYGLHFRRQLALPSRGDRGCLTGSLPSSRHVCPSTPTSTSHPILLPWPGIALFAEPHVGACLHTPGQTPFNTWTSQ